MLKKRGIKHNVLNAKFHEKEAGIVAQAGKLGAVTVATNMAGRGTDIMLGGNAEYLAKAELRKAGLSDELIAESSGYADTDNEEILNARKMFAEAEAKYKDEIKAEADQVRAAGGLFILGTERHESAASTTSSAAAPAARATLGESRFLPVPGGRHHAPVRLRAGHGHDGEAGRGRGHPPLTPRSSPTPLRTPRSRWSPATSRPARPCWSTTT